MFARTLFVRIALRLLYVFVATVLIGIVRDQLGTAGFWEQLLLPWRVARFYTQTADETILVPVRGVGSQTVSNTWHAPRPGGRRHEGQDIFARRGTPVVAAADGVVVRLGGGALGGNAVFVAGRGRRTYYYAHLDRYAGVAVGQIVRQGDVLGYVGNTGNAWNTPPHLHFGVYTATGPIDPLPLMAGAPTREPELAGD
jgi:murein DD-endopeptidase MepM/ murein hydrolase activator NlpD